MSRANWRSSINWRLGNRESGSSRSMNDQYIAAVYEMFRSGIVFTMPHNSSKFLEILELFEKLGILKYSMRNVRLLTNYINHHNLPESVLRVAASKGDGNLSNLLIEIADSKKSSQALSEPKPAWILRRAPHSNENLYGPLNKRVKLGLRMFSTNPLDDTIFRGHCDFCLTKVGKARHCVRFPHANGGWYGYFCSWCCIRMAVAKNAYLTELIDEAERDLNFHGLIEC